MNATPSDAQTPSAKAQMLRQRHAAARAARSAWESRWQDCYAMALPLAGQMRAGSIGTNQVNRADIPLFDGTAADAVDQLAASLLAQLTPPWSRWFAFQPGSDVDPAAKGQAASLLDDASRRAQGHFDRSNFIVELLLQPTAAEDGRLDPDLLRSYGDELDLREAGGRLVLSLGGKRLVSASAFWDPAFGAPRKGRAKGGDGSVVAAVFTDGDGRHYLHRIAYLQHDPARLGETDAATQLCDQVASFVQALHLPSIRVEGNGLGKFLPGLLRQALSRIDCGASVVEHVSHQAKQTRILAAFDAPLAAGRLHAHDSVLASPLILEMREWRPGISATRDDGLDAVAGCLLAEPVRLTQAARPQRRDWRHGNDNLNARAEFDPLKREE